MIGGAIDYSNVLVGLNPSSVTFKSNTGTRFGNDVVTLPSHLRLENLQEFLIASNGIIDHAKSNRIIVNDFPSGGTLSRLVFTLRTSSSPELEISPINESEMNSFKVTASIS